MSAPGPPPRVRTDSGLTHPVVDAPSAASDATTKATSAGLIGRTRPSQSRGCRSTIGSLPPEAAAPPTAPAPTPGPVVDGSAPPPPCGPFAPSPGGPGCPRPPLPPPAGAPTSQTAAAPRARVTPGTAPAPAARAPSRRGQTGAADPSPWDWRPSARSVGGLGPLPGGRPPTQGTGD